jgi:hypothetical protein
MSEGNNRGGFCVPLTVPITHAGITIDVINIAPPRLDHTMRWSEGKFATAVALLAELAGLDEGVLRAITYPDVDRVMGAFMLLLPPAISADINRGVAPVGSASFEQPTGPIEDAGGGDEADLTGFDAGQG